MKVLYSLLLILLVVVDLPFAANSKKIISKKPVYYFVGAFLAHPYVRDIKLGFRYAQNKLKVKIVTLGPQGPDFKAQAKAMSLAIAAQPDGIVIPLWSDEAVPQIKQARSQGIAVIAIEAAPDNHGADTFIGLDNYQSGILTARELIKRGGKTGKLGIVLNKATNTDQKKAGLLDGLKKTNWKVIAEVFDETNTDTATKVAIQMLRDYPDLTAIVGLNSSSGVGIGNAIAQLGMIKKNMTIIVHDREKRVLDFIQKGIIDASIVAKTAYMSYLSIAMLEDYRKRKGKNDVPITADNQKAHINSLPEIIYTGAVVVNKDNVDTFFRKNLQKHMK
ncbi:MAG: sugar ABC transporter substrate-binding protein [Desulfobacteraceae bacterium]|nr:sugar ABC transporter substrate-binding protein [Desulfobacteraceae bacterium]